MKKLFLTFIAALCCTVMAKAEVVYNVPYIDANGVEQICDSATVVNDYDNTWTAGWYILNSYIYAYPERNIVCKGDVHLILKDSYSLNTHGQDGHAGIEVSGEGNSLTIYGQEKQTGRLIATGGDGGAGIGGSGQFGVGNNITINGGRVEAYGGTYACGIGGALSGQGTNITINGGTVFAMSNKESAIGSSQINCEKPASNIFVADRVKVMVSKSTDISDIRKYSARTLLEHSSIEYDIANDIADKCYFASIDYTPFFADMDMLVVGEQEEVFLRFVESIKQRMVESPLILTFDEADEARKLSKAKIEAAKELLPYLPDDESIRQKEYIDYIFNTIASIEQDKGNHVDVYGMVTQKKYEGIGQLQGLKAGFNMGNTEAFGTLGEEQDGPALIVTDKDDKDIILYSPKSVKYVKIKK